MGVFQSAWDPDVLAPCHMAFAHAGCAAFWLKSKVPSFGRSAFSHAQCYAPVFSAGSPHPPTLAERVGGLSFCDSSAASGLSCLGDRTQKPSLPALLAVDDLCLPALRTTAARCCLCCNTGALYRRIDVQAGDRDPPVRSPVAG